MSDEVIKRYLPPRDLTNEPQRGLAELQSQIALLSQLHDRASELLNEAIISNPNSREILVDSAVVLLTGIQLEQAFNTSLTHPSTHDRKIDSIQLQSRLGSSKSRFPLTTLAQQLTGQLTVPQESKDIIGPMLRYVDGLENPRTNSDVQFDMNLLTVLIAFGPVMKPQELESFMNAIKKVDNRFSALDFTEGIKTLAKASRVMQLYFRGASKKWLDTITGIPNTDTYPLPADSYATYQLLDGYLASRQELLPWIIAHHMGYQFSPSEHSNELLLERFSGKKVHALTLQAQSTYEKGQTLSLAQEFTREASASKTTSPTPKERILTQFNNLVQRTTRQSIEIPGNATMPTVTLAGTGEMMTIFCRFSNTDIVALQFDQEGHVLGGFDNVDGQPRIEDVFFDRIASTIAHALEKEGILPKPKTGGTATRRSTS